MDIALRLVRDRAGFPRPCVRSRSVNRSQVGVPLLGSSTLIGSSHALVSREERLADPSCDDFRATGVRLLLCPGSSHRLAAMVFLPAALAAERASPAWLLCLARRAKAICIGTVPARFR
jgi:hypothetical protein